MGVCLILTGFAICVALLMPSLDITLLYKLAPLILVALGIEVLVGSMRGEKLKYDFLSMFMCFLIICGALAASCVPFMMEYYGPAHSEAQGRLQQEWYDNLYAGLAGNADISRVNTRVYLERARSVDDIKTLADVVGEDYLRAEIVLDGSYADKDAFLKACVPVLKAVQESGAVADDVTIRTPQQQEPIAYSLDFDGRYQLEKDVLSQGNRVTESHYDAQDDTYYTAEDYAQLLKNRAAEKAAADAQKAADAAVDAQGT